jgi:outer membrane lipopolysaccharide assembly protein LptE/RlpB
VTGQVRLAAVVTLVAVLAGGCGYSLRPTLPSGIKTLQVPVLENKTSEPGIEDFLTQALIQAIVNSGAAKIARSAESADARLEGQIVGYALTSLSFDRTANATAYRLTVALALTLRDLRKNEVVWKQDRIEDRADFQVAGQVTTNLVRETDALQRAAVDVSRAIVSFAFERF